jgi:uncharacterized protein
MLTAAFILGFTGSLHCVGMCGPIALLVNGVGKKQYFVNRMVYHIGRTTTYMAFGLIMGLMGKVFQFDGWQSYLSVAGGVLILIFLLLPVVKTQIPIATSLYLKLKTALGAQLRSQHMHSKFLTGILNGFLPCGLVYSALVVALVQPTLQQSVMAMAIFGLATVPALFMFTSSAGYIQRYFPMSVNTLQKIALVAVAVIMIWRGVAFAYPDVIPGSSILCHS